MKKVLILTGLTLGLAGVANARTKPVQEGVEAGARVIRPAPARPSARSETPKKPNTAARPAEEVKPRTGTAPRSSTTQEPNFVSTRADAKANGNGDNGGGLAVSRCDAAAYEGLSAEAIAGFVQGETVGVFKGGTCLVKMNDLSARKNGGEVARLMAREAKRLLDAKRKSKVQELSRAEHQRIAEIGFTAYLQAVYGVTATNLEDIFKQVGRGDVEFGREVYAEARADFLSVINECIPVTEEISGAFNTRVASR